MKRVRQLHLYLGVFFAPAIVFFALSGAFQTFGLHESPRGTTVTRPAWIVKLGELHKNQQFRQEQEKSPQGEARPPQKPRASQEESKGPSPLPLKIFVLLMSIGLISTTLLGVYMAFKFNRDRRVVWGLLVTGIVLPLLLLLV